MSTRSQLICAYGAFGLVALFLSGFALCGFITPPSPTDTPVQIAAMFADHRTAIRFGLILSMFGAAMLVPWTAVLHVQLRRADPGRSPVPYVATLSLALLSLEFIYLIMFWQVAAYREDVSPEIVRLLNDMAWIPFVGLTSTGVIAAFAIGWAMLSDKRPTPVFPRWLGYTNFWAGTLLTPGTFCPFFKTGPLAYNGILAWYMVLTAFTIWLVANSVVLLRVIRAEAAEPAPATIEDLAKELAVVRSELDAVREAA